nr:MAG TPA: hypothetical protein [Caudoviricetes sp.]
MRLEQFTDYRSLDRHCEQAERDHPHPGGSSGPGWRGMRRGADHQRGRPDLPTFGRRRAPVFALMEAAGKEVVAYDCCLFIVAHKCRKKGT